MDYRRAGESRKRRTISGKAILIIVLAVSFLAALGFYFANSFITTERENAVYSAMEEPTLPVIYALCGDMEINPMRGHFQDMGNSCADTVTILEDSRKLAIRIEKYGAVISGLSYEIRNLSMDHFIEKTEVTELTEEGGSVYATLPIQNLIEKDNMYLLTIQLSIGEKEANYYTKILWTDKTRYLEMVRLAEDFAKKTFDSEASGELARYMETDPRADNEDIGTVTIGSAFSQVTWADTGMQMAGKPELRLLQCEGVMAAVEVDYRAKISDETGEENFRVTEEYSLRDGGDRIYMMDYYRNVREIFDGSKHRFSGKKIMLGISEKDALETKESENGRYIVFKTDKELWMYDQEGQRAVDVFSFRSKSDDGVRADYRQHDMKTLSVSDTGTVDFVVYGYMNRGQHEGMSGIAYYSYSADTDVLSEIFFAPIANSFEKIGLELSELSSTGNRMYFFKQNNAITGVDLSSLETMSIASGLEIGAFVSNPAGTRAAWVEEGRYGSTSLKVMNVEEGTTGTVEGNGMDYLIPIGYIDNDLIIGYAHPSDKWVSGQRVKGHPMYKLEILNADGSTAMDYVKSGKWIGGVTVTDGRILVELYSRSAITGYRSTGTDTIVRQEKDPYSRAALAGVTTSGTKQKVFYLSVTKEIKNTKKLSVKAPESISSENAGLVEVRFSDRNENVVFYTYSRGKLTGRTESFREAVDAFYDTMGWTTDKNGAVILTRTNKGSYRTVSEPFVAAQPLLNGLEEFTKNTVTEDGYVLLDADGLSLDRVLGFVYKGCPVVVTNDTGKYYLIYGYDKTNVRLYYPTEFEESVTETITREEAEAMIRDRGYAYLCFTPLGQ
ncbi:MAG: hypothetical protein Q4A04_06700 [Eubacteriales bacterium]|nr:hypothetical protein [Eubacteriales bacterium]